MEEILWEDACANTFTATLCACVCEYRDLPAAQFMALSQRRNPVRSIRTTMLARGKSWPPALLMWEKLISCSPAQEESGCPPAHFPLSRTRLRDEAEQQGLLRAWQSQPPPVLTLAWLMSSSMRSCSWPAEALRMACMFSFSTHSCCRSHPSRAGSVTSSTR